jgi:hydrogenase expression/formation protein HypE
LYITTSGVGIIPAGRHLSAQQVRVGDRVVLSGTLGDHGMSVMVARGDLDIEAEIESDTAPVHEMVEALLAAAPNTRWMRDPTRGGLGTICNELAQDAEVAVILDEQLLPVAPMVQGACDMLGIDPIYVANEGKFIAVVPPDEAEAALAALRAHPLGGAAAVIGEIVAEPEGVVALRTAFGGSRIVDMLVGDPLPRIC